MQIALETLRQVLSRYPHIRLCMVFGSAATGRSASGSDIDIAVAAAQPLAADARLELIEAFSSALHSEVDLVDLMADRGHILRQALSKGRIVRNDDKSLYARLISRMLFNQADMMPYHDRILRERRMRFLHG